MEELPLDTRSLVDELRSASAPLTGPQPRTWVPSQSFASLLEDADAQPLVLNEHLAWLHQNWSLEQALAPPEGGGAKGLAKRVAHRVVVAAIHPYLAQLQERIAVTLRAVDSIARRVDQQAATQLRTIGAVRADLVDFAHHVDERLDERLVE